MSLTQELQKKAQAILLQKRGFQPMPGGQPPVDPAMAGGGGAPMDPAMAGGAPMDPAMMGGGAPMDPAMMGGGAPMDPAMAGMDPAMMGGGMMPPGMDMGMGGPMPATIGQLGMLADTITLIFQQIMGDAGGAPAAGGPPEVAPQEDVRTVSNTELAEKVDAILAMLAGGGQMPQEGMPPEMMAPEGMPPSMEMVAPQEQVPPEMMGFGGVSTAGQQPQGMEIQASEKPLGLADMILRRTEKARKG